MTAAVDVIGDRDDDIATVQGSLTASPPSSRPGWRSASSPAHKTRAVIWAILRALGKRSDKLSGERAHWHHVEIWLDAHRITELVVLCAQHLGEGPERELRELGQRTSIAITLVYSGHEAAVHEATITLGNLISRSRWPPGPDPKFEPWPAVPPSCSRCGARIYVRV